MLQLSLVLISFQRQKCAFLRGLRPAWLALSLRVPCVGAGDLEAAGCGERPRSQLRSSPLFVLCGPGGPDLPVRCVASLRSDFEKHKQVPKDANRQNSRKPTAPGETSPLSEN